ncbi:P-loop ATPase, Sll1717 family [Dactylosporangium darangshiense]|uniref:Orc1-like AAA ATPase domain-containing protein n=1 Tax=Dactylosporangium darangshiense TaxID=579108 RepID=A0ABP8CTI6_9ACTN
MNSGPSVLSTGAAPFGNPDGARENLDSLLERFVDFAGNEAFGALATRADDMRARVIVGRMGAGKTVYLRRLQASADHEASVYADTSQGDLPSTESIVRTCQFFERRDLVEMWQRLWSCSITRTVAAHILRQRGLRERLDGELREELQRYAHLIGQGRAPGTVYSHLADILYEYDAKHKLVAYLQRRDWNDLTHFLREAIVDLPPIAFYIDGVDESFAYAPMYWLPCQEGLFHAVMQWLKDHRIGGRLHVVVAIRDVVFSSVLRSEMASKYRGEPHVRVLDWDAASLKYLLYNKIERLDKRYLTEPAAEDPMTAWLGHAEIENLARGSRETAIDYVLRHTRLIPRDLVEIGNSLSNVALRAKRAGSGPPSQQSIRDTVSAAAGAFGNDQIQQCANQISADLAPAKSGQHGYADFYVGRHSYIRDDIVEALRESLLLLGTDRFDAPSLLCARDLLRQHFDGQTDLATVLWQNGLLGFVGKRNGADGTFFYSMGGMSELQPPLSEREYVLHPCLIDAVGIRSVGSRPVRPFA